MNPPLPTRGLPTRTVPTRRLREHPDLDQLKRQAKELLAGFAAGDTQAIAEISAHYRDADRGTFALHDAQLVLARAYGFDSWPKLKAYVDGVTVARLVDAVRADDIAKVSAMLAVRPELVNMDLAENNEHRALHYAVYNRSPEMVRILMRHGANARKGIWPNRDATSAFTIASERGYAEIIAIIESEEQRRGETRWRGDDRGRPWPAGLVEAARRADEDGIIGFFERDPWLQHSNEYLLTPLHRAAANLWQRVAIWLLDRGADVNARIDGGPSPLEIVGHGFGPGKRGDASVASVVELLRSRGAHMTPRAAVAYGEGDWLRARHAEGKLVNTLPKNQGNRGLLEIAVFHNRPDMLELLLDLGFDPDEPVRKGESEEYGRGGPLLCCVRVGRTQMAEMLLARGAALLPWAAVLLGKGEWLRAQHAAGKLENPIGHEGGLVSMAVKHERPDMLALLLDLGLDPDERVRLENLEEAVYSAGGPLHECAARGAIEMAKILVGRGADPNAQVYAAGSPVYVAYGKKNWEMVRLLEQHGGRLDADSVGYVRQREIARKMLSGEIDPGLEPGCTQTAAEKILWSGASGGDPEIVRMALERIDWPRDDPRWFGMLWRPLPGREPWAEEDRDLFIECFRLILGCCNPDVRAERYGQTILHEVIVRDLEDKAVLAKLLLDSGARTDIRDDLLKSTPLGWACRWGRISSVKLLLERGAGAMEADAEAWATPSAWARKMNHDEVLALLRTRGSEA